MLSYRHAFHAGNHADVLKHLVLLELLDYLNRKDKPYWVMDTHAGAGLYDLTRGHATKNAEHADGISRLWNRDDLPPPLAAYVARVRDLNPSGRLVRYPGSPFLALRMMRPVDRLRLFELHGSDIDLLAGHLAEYFPGQDRRYGLAKADGFLALKAVLPPPPRRGLVLIDPAYEDKRDYLRVVMAVKEGLARFATGTFCVWYPILSRGDATQLPLKLRRLPADWLDVQLTVQAPAADGYGMHGSGLYVANPPWTLAKTLRETLPALTGLLARDETASWRVETGDATAGSPARPTGPGARAASPASAAPAQRPRRNNRSRSSSES